MTTHPLQLKVLLLSWLLAAALWPLLWLLLPAAQGVGVSAVGGEWIGLSAPWGSQPWALVNQPGVGFSATRAALVGYWLPPLVVPLLLALLLPPFMPSGQGWVGELAVYHTASAAAVLGLGLAPSLGVADGPAAGLEVFWKLPSLLVVLLAALAGVIGATMASLRLASPLWLAPGGPTRRRRVLIPLLHAGPPLALWQVTVCLAGWRPRSAAAMVAGAVLGVVVVASAWFVTRAPLVRRRGAGWGTIVTAGVLAVTIGGLLAWAGAPQAGSPRGFLWGEERMTSNVRSGTVRLEFTRRPGRTAPPAASAGES